MYECVEEWKYLGNELGNTKVMVVPDEGRLEDALEALRSTCTGTSYPDHCGCLSRVVSNASH